MIKPRQEHQKVMKDEKEAQDDRFEDQEEFKMSDRLKGAKHNHMGLEPQDAIKYYYDDEED